MKKMHYSLLVIGLLVVAVVGSFMIVDRDFERAENMYLRGEYVDAFKIYQNLANRGDARAMLAVSRIYEQGLGQNIYDLNKAFAWTERAAFASNAHAQHRYGQWLYEGDLVKENLTGAEAVWGRAAVSNLDVALNKLLALHGLYWPQSSKGFWIDNISLDRLSTYSDEGELWASLLYGLYLETGKGVERNREQAILQFDRAIAGGMYQAEVFKQLALLDDSAIAEPKAAIDVFKSASDKGMRIAQRELILRGLKGDLDVSVQDILFWHYVYQRFSAEAEDTPTWIAEIEALETQSNLDVADLKKQALNWQKTAQPEGTVALRGMWR